MSCGPSQSYPSQSCAEHDPDGKFERPLLWSGLNNDREFISSRALPEHTFVGFLDRQMSEEKIGAEGNLAPVTPNTRSRRRVAGLKQQLLAVQETLQKRRQELSEMQARIDHDYEEDRRKFEMDGGLARILLMYNIRERDCTVDAYRLLNEYADDGGGSPPIKKEQPTEEGAAEWEEVEEDISVLVEKQAKATKRRRNGESIRRDETETNKKKSCNILRLMPIDVITKANLKDTIDDAGSLFDRYFVREPKTFHRRLNNGLERESVITGIAEMNRDRDRDNKASLKHPELAVIVELIEGLSCPIVPQFSQLQMYNLMEIFT
ncbi:conserved hypothetical protein [Culex quinquefasciatus]|uniref:Uncharacterized protein n=1 Tax=Culex quinquefasciatus TaxID=7176 RepID=B0WPW3_CULQU|nr:conserved hypothetical protein [Culex quinquefasciatus]|eukprot:XP_001850747.1 conserved hypothetical protein [Culex quinquefasciatus]